MARFALITGIKHDEKAPVVISEPSTPFDEQRTKFKAFLASREHPEFCEVHLIHSDAGIVRTKKFVKAGTPAMARPGSGKRPRGGKAAQGDAKGSGQDPAPAEASS